MKIELQPHSLILLVGPSNSGKSHFVRTKLKPALGNLMVSVSSDECRREILGQDFHKFSPIMDAASHEAFQLLNVKLKAFMSFPMSVRNHYVVVDTTGMSSKFRQEMINLAKEYNYQPTVIVFDYSDNLDEYDRFTPDEDINHHIMGRQLRKLRKEVMQDLRSSVYKGGIFRIKTKLENFSDVEITTSTTAPLASYVRGDQDSFIIGDIHGCYDELIELLTKAGFVIIDGVIQPNKANVVLVGDLVDRGPKPLEVLKFILRNKHRITVVLGNHEERLLRYLHTGEMHEGSRQYYTSTSLIDEGNQEFISCLTEVINLSLACLITDRYVVTHSPVHSKYIGRLDPKSNERCVKFHYEVDKTEDAQPQLEQILSWIHDDTVMHWPLLICGHIALKDVSKAGGRLFIDTGCCYGNKLSGVFVGYGGKYRVLSVPAKETYKEYQGNLVSIFNQRKETYIDLDPKDLRRINKMTKGDYPVNFISGTMPPADKLEVDDQDPILESMEQALSYYKAQGINQVILQRKEMGSRAQVYIVKKDKENAEPIKTDPITS